jgi:predicted dehydrogenase
VSEPLRTGVIGGGLIAQTVHLPTLAALPEHFQCVAIADPSRVVREALAARYDVHAHEDWRVLLDEEELDAVVVCSPHATHAEITLAALDRGVHVLVEKPLCIGVDDADAICARQVATGRVVQVGYMKRYDVGFASLLQALPADATDLRFIDVVTYDPWMARPPFAPADLIVGRDIPESVLRAAAERERAQVEAAVGRGDPASVKAFSYTFLACLVHDVNLVHGVLERLGVTLPLPAIGAGHWADGRAAEATFRLPDGALWRSAWLLLEGLEEFRETASFYFGNAIHTLRFSAPYLREQPTIHEIVAGDHGTQRRSRTAKIVDAYRAELEHFHACVVDGAVCRTPPEQARLDLAALREAFLAQRQG